jgi:hypothetical protein
MPARHRQHEAILAERKRGQRPGVDRAGDEADVGDAFGD